MCDYCAWIDQILAKIKTEAKPDRRKRRLYVDPVLIVHGGAGKIPRKKRDYMIYEVGGRMRTLTFGILNSLNEQVKNAAIEAYSLLINGRSAVDAVEKAIVHLESKPLFNCARGGSLDINDEIVMDAGMMTRKNAGFVGAVRDIEHPICLARKVLEKTEHVLIVEAGAQKFALDHGIPILQPGSLHVYESISTFEDITCCVNEEEYEGGRWNDNISEEKDVCDSDCFITRGSIGGESYPYCVQPYDSELWDDSLILQAGAVGAVAYDRKKRFASGTSTAGEPGKPVGTVSAIGTVIGCGIYTDEHGSASVSGDESSIYSYAPARRIVSKLSENKPICHAVNSVLQDFEMKTKECNIGAVALSAKGEPFISFKCSQFPWAFCRKGYVYYGLGKCERYWEKLTVLERPLDCMCLSSDDEEI